MTAATSTAMASHAAPLPLPGIAPHPAALHPHGAPNVRPFAHGGGLVGAALSTYSITKNTSSLLHHVNGAAEGIKTIQEHREANDFLHTADDMVSTAEKAAKLGSKVVQESKFLGAVEGVAAKSLGVLAVAQGVYTTGHGIATGNTEEMIDGSFGAVGAYEGAILGASWGASIGGTAGSIIPGAGTVVGATVGGAVGGAVGALAGSEVGKTVGHVYVAQEEIKRQIGREVADNLIHSDAGQAVIGAAGEATKVIASTELGKQAIAGATSLAHGAESLAHDAVAGAKELTAKASDGAKLAMHNASEFAKSETGKVAIQVAETSLNAVGHLTGVSQAIEIGKGAVAAYHSKEGQAAIAEAKEVVGAATNAVVREAKTVYDASATFVSNATETVQNIAYNSIAAGAGTKNAEFIAQQTQSLAFEAGQAAHKAATAVSETAASIGNGIAKTASAQWDTATQYAMDTKDSLIGNNSILQKTLTKQGVDAKALATVDADHNGSVTASEARSYLLAHGEKAEAVKTLTANELGMHLASQLSAEHLAAVKAAGAQVVSAGTQDTSHSAAGETPPAPVIANVNQQQQSGMARA